MNQHNKHGFTIVELLIVIVVIAILATISFVAYTGIQDRARSAAHQQEAAQVERQIMTYASLQGDDSTDISGRLIGYQQGIGERKLIHSLSGTPDVTMYTVCTVVSTTANYQNITRLAPFSSTTSFVLLTSASGVANMASRIDTPSQSNSNGSAAGIRTTGSTLIGWLQVSNGLTLRSTGWNQAAPTASSSLNPGTGWSTFTSIDVVNQNDCAPKVALVFDTAHSEAVRASVIGWLAEKYGVNL